MSMPVILHHAPQSRSFRVLWFLHEAGIPHEVRALSFVDKSLRDPAFLKISPAGRVPAVEVDGRTMAESGAIIQYLAETRAPALGRPPGDPERAPYLEWMHHGETIAQHMAVLTFQHVVLRPETRSASYMRLETGRLKRVLAGVAGRLGPHDWLLASGFSAADVMLGATLEIARRFVRLEEMPALAEYRARLAARPAFAAARAVDGPAELYRQDFYEMPDG
jgi:glutathione S-transferase